MPNVDLHVHSNASDGTFTPTEVVERAIQNNISAFALTDHDTISGIPEAIAATQTWYQKGSPIRVIPGVELSAQYKQKDVHILGLFVDYQDENFCKVLENAQKERTHRNEKMARNLSNADIDISIDKLQKIFPNAVITRAHFAKYLTDKGYTKSNKEAFDKYLSSNGPFYVPREYMSPEESISLIHSVGGVSILAHPLLYKLSPSQLFHLITNLKEAGLDAIEAIHSSNVNNDESYLKGLAKKYNLLISGGSDFHGSNKPQIDMGVGKGNLTIPYSVLEKLENKEHRTCPGTFSSPNP